MLGQKTEQKGLSFVFLFYIYVCECLINSVKMLNVTLI